MLGFGCALQLMASIFLLLHLTENWATASTAPPSTSYGDFPPPPENPGGKCQYTKIENGVVDGAGMDGCCPAFPLDKCLRDCAKRPDCKSTEYGKNGGTCHHNVRRKFKEYDPAWKGTGEYDYYEKTDENCYEADECALRGRYCHVDAECVDSNGIFTCKCNEGYSGDGITCTDVDECALDSSPCHADAVCSNNIGNFTCECNEGYSGDGITCTVVDGCAFLPSPCHADAVCTNSNGGFTCECKEGYSGDGFTCESEQGLTDLGLCLSAPCKNGGICRNEVEGYSCECEKGYSGTECELIKMMCYQA